MPYSEAALLLRVGFLNNVTLGRFVEFWLQR